MRASISRAPAARSHSGASDAGALPTATPTSAQAAAVSSGRPSACGSWRVPATRTTKCPGRPTPSTVMPARLPTAIHSVAQAMGMAEPRAMTECR